MGAGRCWRDTPLASKSEKYNGGLSFNWTEAARAAALRLSAASGQPRHSLSTLAALRAVAAAASDNTQLLLEVPRLQAPLGLRLLLCSSVLARGAFKNKLASKQVLTKQRATMS